MKINSILELSRPLFFSKRKIWALKSFILKEKFKKTIWTLEKNVFFYHLLLLLFYSS